jgi:hypothetical protein
VSVEDPAEQVAPRVAGSSDADDVLRGDLDPAPIHHRPGWLARVGLVGTGVFIAAIGVGAAASRSVVHDTTVLWGLVLVLVTLGVCVRAGAWVLGTRRGAVLVGAGWAFLTLVFVTYNPGGDVLLPDVTRTRVYLLGGALIVLVAILWPLPSGARELVEGAPAPLTTEDPAPRD